MKFMSELQFQVQQVWRVREKVSRWTKWISWRNCHRGFSINRFVESLQIDFLQNLQWRHDTLLHWQCLTRILTVCDEILQSVEKQWSQTFTNGVERYMHHFYASLHLGPRSIPAVWKKNQLSTFCTSCWKSLQDGKGSSWGSHIAPQGGRCTTPQWQGRK